MANRAGALMVSPWRMATVRADLLWWPPVMIPAGSGGTLPLSYRKMLTWSLAASRAQMLPSRTK
jgi:hypothetical protein